VISPFLGRSRVSHYDVAYSISHINVGCKDTISHMRVNMQPHNFFICYIRIHDVTYVTSYEIAYAMSQTPCHMWMEDAIRNITHYYTHICIYINIRTSISTSIWVSTFNSYIFSQIVRLQEAIFIWPILMCISPSMCIHVCIFEMLLLDAALY
jgi:hypothetical protein